MKSMYTLNNNENIAKFKLVDDIALKCVLIWKPNPKFNFDTSL